MRRGFRNGTPGKIEKIRPIVPLLPHNYTRAMANPLLAVTNLGKSFGTARALAGVTLKVQEGEIFGLLGPNGAGKTTLRSLISGLLEPDSGSVLLLGQTTCARDRKHLLGMAPQDLALYGELTARENLRLSLDNFMVGADGS